LKLIIIPKKRHSAPNKALEAVRCATSTEPVAGVMFNCLRNSYSQFKSDSTVIAVPYEWAAKSVGSHLGIFYYKENLPVGTATDRYLKADRWLVLVNGTFSVQTDVSRLYRVLAKSDADVIAVNVVAHLGASYEKVLTCSGNKLVGFRRFYDNCVQPGPTPKDWPHLIFIKTGVLARLLINDALPAAFGKFVGRCSSHDVTMLCLDIGGSVLDLGTEQGLMSFIAKGLDGCSESCHGINNQARRQSHAQKVGAISPTARFFGNVVIGHNVSIGQNVIVVGPTIIGDDVKIGKSAVVKKSVIGAGISVPQNQCIQDTIVVSSPLFYAKDKVTDSARLKSGRVSSAIRHHKQGTYKDDGKMRATFAGNNFRRWPKFSYVSSVKRLADIIASVVVLMLFVPVFPVIALAIKLSSPGPVFFKDKRQGLHGREFHCFKFRTMTAGADTIQEKLRFKSHVDGPQFKVEGDPRVTAVGEFLRNTFLDEVPQFINVLLGQMSLVGPRPSPEAENSLCPTWRDARLSVRPGITGLWQICRTRKAGRDFQEWIYYDTEYVRKLSFRLDLWICLRTAGKLILNFIDQF